MRVRQQETKYDQVVTFAELYYHGWKFHKPRNAVTGLTNVLILSGNECIGDTAHYTSVLIRRRTWAGSFLEVYDVGIHQKSVFFEAAFVVRII